MYQNIWIFKKTKLLNILKKKFMIHNKNFEASLKEVLSIFNKY